MIKICMNIGRSNGPYNDIPMFWEVENIRDFTDFIRKDIFNILLWSHDNWGQTSGLWIGLHIEEDSKHVDDEYFSWNFKVWCKNIREFKQYLEMDRYEIEELKSRINRDSAINKILD